MYYPCKRSDGWHVIEAATSKTVAGPYVDRFKAAGAIRRRVWNRADSIELDALDLVFDEADLDRA